MAISISKLTGAVGNPSGGKYTTASVTPTAGNVLIGCFMTENTASTITGTVTGCNLTWVYIGKCNNHGIAGTALMFVGIGNNPSAGTIEYTPSNDGDTGGWLIAEVSGGHPANLVVQTKEVSSDGSSITATYDSAMGTGNATFAMGLVENASANPEAGYTELYETGNRGDNGINMECQWKATTDTATTLSRASGSGHNGILGVELYAFASGVKTQDTIDRALVKTRDTIASASIKTFDGIQ